MNNLKVSIIVPAHKVDLAFSKCVEALSDLAPPPDEVLIVLDGIAEATAKPFIAKTFKILDLGKKSGPAAARNVGVANATGEILIFIDSDVAAPSFLIKVVRDEFNQHPDVSALFGSYDDQPGHHNFFSQYKNLMHHFIHQHSMEEASTFWGACGAIRRAVFERIGGFDESLLWLEDVDLGLRLKGQGFKIKLVKNLQVTHWKKWTAGSLLNSDIFHRALPWTKLILRYGSLQNDLNTNTSARLSALFIFLGLILLIISPLFPGGILLAALVPVILLVINWPFYSFLLERKGVLFTVFGVLWHWFYFFYSTLAFTAGILLATIWGVKQFEGND